jgi:hypothetical protein
MTSDVWIALGTAAATFALLVVPGLVFTWFLLERMIGDDHSYEEVVASIRT